MVSHWPGGTKSEVPERINDVCCVGDPDGICSLRAFPLLTLSGCKRSDDLSNCYALSISSNLKRKTRSDVR